MRFILILLGTTISFFIGGNLTRNIVGAFIFAGIGLGIMIVATRRLKKRRIPLTEQQKQEADELAEKAYWDYHHGPGGKFKNPFRK